ncbi:MAG TPA: amino acid adenylation domain-containing protein, partial [Longimicrobiaceae bacterium]
LFINTLPVRVRTRPDRSALSWLRELQERQAELREHEHTSLVKVARWSEVPAGAPLFHTLLVFENYPLDAALGAGTGRVRVETREGIEQVSYPLALRVVPGAALGMQVQYDRERLDDDAAGRVLEHLETLLSALAAAPERRLSGISLLSAAGRERLLRGWTETPGALPDPRPLHEAFAAQAAATPEVPAVAAGDGTITYAELAARAGRLARHLRSLGVGPESRVALGVEPGPDLVVGVLGILGAGGAYVPLDPAYPRERLARMLAGAGAEVLVTTAALAGALEADGIERVLLDADGERIASWPDTAPDVAVDPAGLAYVIYTSGSTGTPRGVMVSHASVANLLDDFRRRAPIAPGDRCSVWTSASFDVSVWELFSALLSGGTLVFPPDEARADPAALARWLADERVRSAYLPPFVLSGVAEWAAAHPGALALRRLLVGVEPIPEATLQALLAAVPGLRILNGYGPTEATVCATLYPVEPRAAEPGRPVPIGRAVRGLRVYLADAALEPVPDGLSGELCVSGAGVARGYLGDPAATAARFVPDPFAGEPGARMYRTGDLARALPDGELEFLGRLDRQVKLRGFRVEPGEVEAVLLRHPGVREAVVQVRPDAAGEPRLAAWVVPSGTPPSTEELRAHARSLLPRHMVPTAWMALDALPLTPNGKLDARALPAPGGGEAPREHAAPRTALEEVLAGIWADVLGVPRVGVHDDFFELGGHSLLVTRIASLLRQTLQVQLPLRVLFDAHTVARLAGEVERHEAQPGRAEWTARAVLSVASMSPGEVRRRLQEREPAGAG